MGTSLGKALSEEQEKFVIQLKRQNLEFGMRMRASMIAAKIAEGKERFKYYSVFVLTLWVKLPILSYIRQKPLMLLGLFPASFSWVYQYNLFYGT